MSTAATSIDQLRSDLLAAFPDAGFRLTQPAASVDEVEERLDAVCDLATMARGCAGELERREEYNRFILAFSEAVGVDTEKTQSAFERILPKGLLAGGADPTLLVLGTAADAAGSGAELADVVGHGFDLMHGFAAVGTLGLSVLLSLWARNHEARKTREKEAKVSRLTEEALVRGRLAHALMTPGGLGCVREELERLRAIQADRTGGEVE